MRRPSRLWPCAGLLLGLGIATAPLAACESDGPFEDAGEEVDDAIDEAGEALEDAGDEIQDELDD